MTQVRSTDTDPKVMNLKIHTSEGIGAPGRLLPLLVVRARVSLLDSFAVSRYGFNVDIDIWAQETMINVLEYVTNDELMLCSAFHGQYGGEELLQLGQARQETSGASAPHFYLYLPTACYFHVAEHLERAADESGHEEAPICAFFNYSASPSASVPVSISLSQARQYIY